MEILFFVSRFLVPSGGNGKSRFSGCALVVVVSGGAVLFAGVTSWEGFCFVARICFFCILRQYPPKPLPQSAAFWRRFLVFVLRKRTRVHVFACVCMC